MLVLASMWLRKSAACDCISRLLMLVSCPASLLDNAAQGIQNFLFAPVWAAQVLCIYGRQYSRLQVAFTTAAAIMSQTGHAQHDGRHDL